MKIGMCFPVKDYQNNNFNDFKNYILKLKSAGLTNIDMFSSFIIDYNNEIDNLLEFLNNNDIKISFHYSGENNYEIYQNHILTVRNRMKASNMNYETTMVFHAPDYETEYNKYEHMKKVINDFQKLSLYAKDFDIKILLETLSCEMPKGKHIGDDIEELELIANNIENNNFGFCWDLGHTSLDSDKGLKDELLTNKMISKTSFTHIHSYNKEIDHLPLIKPEQVENEIELLKKVGYQGVYSLEFEVLNLKENIDMYIESINNLKKLLIK